MPGLVRDDRLSHRTLPADAVTARTGAKRAQDVYNEILAHRTGIGELLDQISPRRNGPGV